MTTMLDTVPGKESQGQPNGTNGGRPQEPSNKPETQSEPPSRGEHWLFTDAMGGLWAGITTILCVVVVAIGNLVLLAATLGASARQPGHWSYDRAAIWAGLIGGATAVITLMLGVIWVCSGCGRTWRRRMTIVCGYAAVGGLLTSLLVAALYGIAWLAAVSDKPFPWQPVVGFTMSVVAVASFGGYYLASRRARVGFAASFVSTFLVLLSFMLTLDGLAHAANGEAQGAANAVQGLLTDFRGSVAIIVGFYFGTDAAVSVAKMIKAGGSDPREISRLDRDIAVPRH